MPDPALMVTVVAVVDLRAKIDVEDVPALYRPHRNDAAALVDPEDDAIGTMTTRQRPGRRFADRRAAVRPAAARPI
ncbi:MAG TPA: hypothetical protein VME44_22015 [Streptosporangiaceae bacterium]|nr:hypothetical protein [Streptosporangiaceae bacterium]